MPLDPANPEPDEAHSSRWVLVVRSLPGQEVPIESRVKRWLKCGLRGFGIRCIEVSGLTPDEQHERLKAEVEALRAENAKLVRLTRAAGKRSRG